MCSGRSCASCGCCYYSCPALAFVEAMSVLSAFFSPAPFWDICYRLYLQNETWTGYTKGFLLIGLSVLPNKGDCRESCPCTECPWQQHSSQNLPLHPVNLKSKILVASFLTKLFLSVIFPLTIGVEDELSLLLMNILGHSYSDWPDADPL